MCARHVCARGLCTCEQPARVRRGIKRREELTKVFNAISRAELKKGLEALGFEAVDGNKEELVSGLVNRFAPKKKKRRLPEED